MSTLDQFGFDFGFAPSPAIAGHAPAEAAAPAFDERSRKRTMRCVRKVHTQASKQTSGQMDFFGPEAVLNTSSNSSATAGSPAPGTESANDDLEIRVSASTEPDAVSTSSTIPTLSHGTRPANIAEALAMIEEAGLFTETQRRKHRSFVNVAAKALQKVDREPDLTLLPCEPRLLREMLVAFHPAQARIRRDQWASIVSGLRRILRMTGWLRPVSRTIPRSAAWEAILADIKNQAQLAAIRQFANFATSMAVESHGVTHETFATYRAWLEEQSLTLTHRALANGAMQTWRRLCRENPDWGIAPLPERPHYNLVATRKDDLPATFHSSAEAYLARCAAPDPFDERIGRAIASETLRKRRTYIYLGAQYLLELDWPAERLDHISALCTPAAVGAVLREQFRRHSPDGRTWPPGARPMASHLQTMAAQVGDLAEADFLKVKRLAGRVPRARAGFPKRTRERLAVFDDERVLRDFYKLPQTLWREARELEKVARLRQARAKAKCAIALAILLVKPLRAGELASLDFRGDFRRDRKGRIIGLSIPGSRTKTGVPIEAAIDGALAKRIVEYFDFAVRPLGLAGETHLFPRKEGGQIAGNNLAQGLSREIWRHLGIEFNSHLARALIATIILDSDPDAVAVAQRMLEHTHVDTTIRHYGMQRGRAAQRQYEEAVTRALRGRAT